LGIQGNIIELRAFGGRTTDAYTGTSLTLDDAVELRAYHQHIQLDQLVTGATVSPITTLQADLADARRHAKRPDSLDGDSSIDRARALLGSHLLDIAAETTTPADVSSPTAVPAPSPTVEYRYGLVLAGMSVYSAQIAQASGLTVQDFNITHLYRGLAADLASDPDVVFDGHTTSGFARVGACPLKLDCPAGTDFDAKPKCRTACDLFANSPRAYLARAILAWLGDAKNKSGISPEDLRSRLEQMAGNTEPNLFGPTLPEALLTDGPAITFDSPSGTVMGLVDIKVTAVSPVGVQSLTVGWDSTTPGPALVDANPDPAVFEVHGFDTTQLGDAEWTLTATATDALGHTTDGSKHSFFIDNIGFGTVSGVAIKGPITGATVRAFRFAGGVRGALLGTGTTNASGVFSNITLAQGYSGPVEVAVGQTGTYTEESSPVQVTVDVDNELRTVIPNYADGQAVGQVVVTPITSFAAAYLDWKVAQAGATANIPTLWQEAVAVMQAQFDIPDIEHLTPIAPSSIVTLSGGARYSLALVGLSQRALQVSSNRPSGSGDAGSFPSVMNSLVVTAKLEADLRSDGCWNGKSGATDLLYGGTTKLSKDDTRIGLASAIVAYVQGPENQTPFAGAGDLLGLLDTLSLGGISTGAGGCPGGGIYPDDGTGYDQVGPTVAFTAEPGDLVALDPVVRGTIHLVATGDDHGVDPKPSTVLQREASPNPIPLVDTDGDATDADAHVTIDTVALGDGPQTLTAKSTDDSGNVGTAQHSFIADNTAPVLSVTGVQNGDSYADNRVITFKQDDANPGTTTATLNGAAFTSGSQVTQDADYTLIVTGTDQAKNPALPLTVTFKLNRMGPIISITGVAANQYYNTARTIGFSQNGTGGTISATLNGLPLTSDSMVTLDNEYDLVVNATNAAGLTGTTSLHFTIDTIAPVITFGGVADDGAYKESVFVTFGQNDLHKGTTTALLNNAAIVNGTTVSTDADYQLKLTATDLAGNLATPVTLAFVVDKLAPTIEIVGVVNGQYYNATRTITFTAPGESHLASLTAKLNNLPFTSGSSVALDNGYTLIVTATDTAGNSSSQPVGFTIDKVVPVLKYTGFTAGQFIKQDVTIGLDQIELHPGPIVAKLDNVAYTSGTAVTSEGLHTLVLNTTDLAGNVATQVTVAFTIDKTAPTISVGGVSPGAFYNGSKTPTFELSEAGTITATLDGTVITSGTPVSSEGPHTLVVDGTDKAGNAATQVTVKFTIDVTAPTITVTGPGPENGVATNGAYNSTRVLAWLMTDTNPGTTTATLKTGNGAPQPITSPSSITAMAGVENTYQLVINGSDLAGNAAQTVTINFVVDLKAPTVAILDNTTSAPIATGTYYNADKTFKVVQSDVKVGANAITLNGLPTGSPTTTATAANGEITYTVQAIPTDAAGNVGNAVSVTFYVDLHDPEIKFPGGGLVTDNTPDYYWAQDTGVTFTGTVTDANMPMTGMTLWYDGTDVDTNKEAYAGTVTGNMWTVTVAAGTLRDGGTVNDLDFVATDKAGRSSTKTVHVRVDSTPPTIVVAGGAVHDERKDVVSFDTASVPSHAHNGPLTTLDETTGVSCTLDPATHGGTGPQVYKHTYLMDATSPPGTTETSSPTGTTNPIQWKFTPGDTGVGIDATSGEFQVRLASAATWPAAWTPAPETSSGSGVFAANVYRSVLAAVGTDEAVFQVRVRARDKFNRATTSNTLCWVNHPLAAPLDLSAGGLPVATADTGLNPLVNASLPNDDAGILALINSTATGYALIKVPINNGTPENVYLRLGVEGSGLATAKYERDYVTTSALVTTTTYSATSPRDCNCGKTATACGLTGPSASAPVDGGATLVSSVANLHLVAALYDVSGASPALVTPVSGVYKLVPRAGLTQPKKYLAVITTTGLPDLAPGAAPYSKYTLTWNNTANTNTFVGKLGTSLTQCTTTTTKFDDSCTDAQHPGGQTVYKCLAESNFTGFTALTKAAMTFQLGSAATLTGQTSHLTGSTSSTEYQWKDLPRTWQPFATPSAWSTKENSVPACNQSAPNCPPTP
jgi:hypothetical protein